MNLNATIRMNLEACPSGKGLGFVVKTAAMDGTDSAVSAVGSAAEKIIEKAPYLKNDC